MAHKHADAALRKMLTLAALLSLSLGVSCARAAPQLSMTAFRDAYIAAVRQAHPEDRVKIVADDEVDVTDAKGATATTYLDHAYGYYKADPTVLKEVLDREVAAISMANADLAITAAKLIVLVRPSSFVPSSGPAAATPPLYRPLTGDLVALVALDQPNAWAYPPAGQLQSALKMDDDAIWARALANTTPQLPGLPKQNPHHALMGLTTGHGISSSVLAVPGIWDVPGSDSEGPFVVAPVSKDMVMVTHLRDTKGIDALRRFAASNQNDPDGLSDRVFVRRDGAWAELPP